MVNLTGKVAFITGIARGQGRAHAVAMAREGADIVGVDICADIATVPYPLSTERDLEETIGLVEAEGQKIIASVTDVRDLDGLRRAVDHGMSAFGRLDIVVSNAGVATLAEPDADIGPQCWNDVIDVNLTGAWNTAAATVPALKATSEGGSIVLISSAAGLVGVPSMTLAPYVASKHGLVGLMKCLALTLAPHSIRVNTVHPTSVATPMVMNEAFARYFAEYPSVAAAIGNALPVELVDATDISAAVGWLVSDAARYVTGTTLNVDAGAAIK